MKEKIDKLDFIKNKNLHSVKDTVKRMKRQVMNQKKIFANHISDKRYVSTICKQHFKLNKKIFKKFKNEQEI